MGCVRGRTVLITVTVSMVIANIVVFGVAVYLASTSQTDRQPAAEAQRFKDYIDSKIADAVKLAEKSFKDNSSEIKDALDLTFLNLLKPMAFLHGVGPFDESDIQGGRTTVRNWITTDGLKKAELLNGMKYARGRVIVPESGCYRVTVSAMMHYEGTRGHCKTFSLDVIRYNANTKKEEVIYRENEEMCPETKDGASDYHSHFVGLVELNPGDQIFVVVSDLSLLKTHRDDHYFQVCLT
ncbi:uncharacterized protein LOC124274966 isoform X2 [Haliotis rubra]|nr:uncharacterized protein LOC124274966 isoform X2 [Haliotis rubra]